MRVKGLPALVGAAGLAGLAITAGGAGAVTPMGASAAPVGAARLATTAATPPVPDPLTQPLKDGCQRNPAGLFSRTSPEWAYVYNTPASQPPPPPQWITGTVSSGNPAYQAVHTSGGDLPFGHRAYDYNVNILPDPQYVFLVGGSPAAGTGNYAGHGEDYARLHTEWEDLSVPQFAWAEPGDRLTELGSWVWDCGHWGTSTEVANPDYVLPKVGQPKAGCLVPAHVPSVVDTSQCRLTGEGTEFHPYRALWDVRARSTTSPVGEAEAELFVSTDKTLAGVEADCAHKHPATTSAGYPPAYRACLDSEPVWQDVSGDYSFLLPAPPRPSATAQLTMRAVDHGSNGAPAPELTREGDGVRVRFHLHTAPRQALAMAYSVYAGWTEVSAASLPVHLHVTLDRLDVHRAMDPGCTVNAFGLPIPGCPYKSESTRDNQLSTTPANWNLYYDLSGVWGQWSDHGNGELHVNDTSSLAGTQSADIYVPPGQGWRFFVHGRECDLGALGVERDCPSDKDVADDNDVQGMILDTYASADASIGTHTSDGLTARADPTSTCPDVNSHGCYSLTYTVSAVHDEAARLAAFAQATPGATVQSPNTTRGALGWGGIVAAAIGLLAVLGGTRALRRRGA